MNFRVPSVENLKISGGKVTWKLKNTESTEQGNLQEMSSFSTIVGLSNEVDVDDKGDGALTEVTHKQDYTAIAERSSWPSFIFFTIS